MRLRYLVNILSLLLISCGMNEEKKSHKEYPVTEEKVSEGEYPLSDEERLYNRCYASLSDDIILDELEIWNIVVVSFCYGNDTINVLSFSDDIYKDLNMKILDETTFQKSLYAHLSKNTPIDVDSTLFAKYSQYKIEPCPKVTELYKTKGIGAVLWHYMKRERYIKNEHYTPDRSQRIKEENPIQISLIKEKKNLIRYIVYLAFQHRIFFDLTIGLDYRLDDKGVEVKEKAQWKEMAEDGKIK